MNKANNIGFTALHRAAVNGHHNICKLLIARGATLDKSDSNGSTALYFAVLMGHLAGPPLFK